MPRATLLPAIIVLAVIVGGLLYLYGGPAFRQTYTTTQAPSGFRVDAKPFIIGEGQHAAGVDQRVNYRITDAGQLADLWQMVYAGSGQGAPNVDFTTYEVLALFDGSHSTGGYGIQLSSVEEKDGARVVTVTHTAPGDSCVPPGGTTSPFVFVRVPKSSLPLSRVDVADTRECE